MKVCCTCREDKELSCFGKNKNTKDGLSAQCQNCAKNYRETHKKERRGYLSSTPGYRTEYRAKNKDHINKLSRERYKDNPEPFHKQSKKSHEKNREVRLTAQREYYQDNQEYFSIKNKLYKENNREAILLKNRKRKMKIIGKNISQKQVKELLSFHSNECFYCHVNVKSGINLHLDHMIPLYKGGTHTIENLAPACNTCNLKKGKMTASEFLERRELDGK
jgi:5-methylcytosine-specific restriction endonuclease McrA